MKHKCSSSYLTINTFQFLASIMASHILTSLPTFPFFFFYLLLFLRSHGHVTQCSPSLFKVAFEFSFSENFKRHLLSIIIEFFVKLKEHGDCKFDSRSNYFRSLIYPNNRHRDKGDNCSPSPKFWLNQEQNHQKTLYFLLPPQISRPSTTTDPAVTADVLKKDGKITPCPLFLPSRSQRRMGIILLHVGSKFPAANTHILSAQTYFPGSLQL